MFKLTYFQITRIKYIKDIKINRVLTNSLKLWNVIGKGDDVYEAVCKAGDVFLHDKVDMPMLLFWLRYALVPGTVPMTECMYVSLLELANNYVYCVALLFLIFSITRRFACNINS